MKSFMATEYILLSFQWNSWSLLRYHEELWALGRDQEIHIDMDKITLTKTGANKAPDMS